MPWKTDKIVRQELDAVAICDRILENRVGIKLDIKRDNARSVVIAKSETNLAFGQLKLLKIRFGLRKGIAEFTGDRDSTSFPHGVRPSLPR